MNNQLLPDASKFQGDLDLSTGVANIGVEIGIQYFLQRNIEEGK